MFVKLISISEWHFLFAFAFHPELSLQLHFPPSIRTRGMGMNALRMNECIQQQDRVSLFIAFCCFSFSTPSNDHGKALHPRIMECYWNVDEFFQQVIVLLSSFFCFCYYRMFSFFLDCAWDKPEASPGPVCPLFVCDHLFL